MIVGEWAGGCAVPSRVCMSRLFVREFSIRSF
jgi:hypothetical protein